MPDQYARTRAQLGTPALDGLRRAHVAVFGIGGVGGPAMTFGKSNAKVYVPAQTG